jgi:hypothetical protein
VNPFSFWDLDRFGVGSDGWMVYFDGFVLINGFEEEFH